MGKRPRRGNAVANHKNIRAIPDPKVSQLNVSRVAHTGASSYTTDGLQTANSERVTRVERAIPGIESSPDANPSIEPPPTRTHAGERLDDYMRHSELLGECLLEHHWHTRLGELCTCGRDTVTTTCYDCDDYHPTCSQCFIEKHSASWLHWAHTWSGTPSFRRRQDISCLSDDFAIQLGHSLDVDSRCPKGAKLDNTQFTIVDVNGIHATRVRFCQCVGSKEHVVQLMRARLFPASTKDPRTAFTFRLMKLHQMLQLQAKTSTYNVYLSLQRMTDNVFTGDAPDPYQALIVSARVWAYLTLKKRTGNMHGLTTRSNFPSRPPGSYALFCPACPQPGVNMETGRVDAPEWLRHLYTARRTLDGNFQSNQYIKNTDSVNNSLFNGAAYFPRDADYKQYLRTMPNSTEKCTCSHIKATEKQNKGKFTGMRVSGVAVCQCWHVFIQGCVDLQLGERFGQMDYALVHALHLSMFDEEVDNDFSYDSGCSYCVNFRARIEKYLPHAKFAIKRIRWGLPAMHVLNHKEFCMYYYGGAYQLAWAHFHGETAEHYWPFLNKSAPQTRQMSSGHREDVLIDLHGDWNWSKTISIATTLKNELRTAQERFRQKLSHFRGLIEANGDRVQVWEKMDRCRTAVQGKTEVRSVYRLLRSTGSETLHDLRTFLTSPQVPGESTSQVRYVI